MSKTLILTPQAEKDFRTAYEWYEEKEVGLGKEFAQSVDLKLASVLQSPKQYSVIYKSLVRRALTNRFPFSIYFIDEEDSILIFAILHQHRNPNMWQSRT